MNYYARESSIPYSLLRFHRQNITTTSYEEPAPGSKGVRARVWVVIGSFSRKTAFAQGGDPRKQLANLGKARQAEIHSKEKVLFVHAGVRTYVCADRIMLSARHTSTYHTSARHTCMCFDVFYWLPMHTSYYWNPLGKKDTHHTPHTTQTEQRRNAKKKCQEKKAFRVLSTTSSSPCTISHTHTHRDHTFRLSPPLPLWQK